MASTCSASSEGHMPHQENQKGIKFVEEKHVCERAIKTKGRY